MEAGIEWIEGIEEKGGYGVGKWYGGGSAGNGGGSIIIKYEMARMEHVEHKTTIENNVMKEDDIEDF